MQFGEKKNQNRIESVLFCFKDGNGLYLILAYEGKEDKEFFKELLESLSYTGIGGKRSAGFGRFEAVEGKMPESLRKKLTDIGKMNILLSTALPQKQQLEKVLEEATYTLIRRGGFIDSQNLKRRTEKKKRYIMFLLRVPVLKQLFQVRLRKKKLEENILFFAMKKHSSWG